MTAQAAVLGGLFGRQQTARNPFSRRKRVSSCVRQRPVEGHEDSRYPSLGNRLDGEFLAAFPSGDGTPGGDFIATYALDYAVTAYGWAEMGSRSARAGGISDNAGSSSGVSLAAGADGLPVAAWMDNSSGNSHVTAQAAVLGGYPTRAGDGALSYWALRNPSESDGFLRVEHEHSR